MCRWQCEAVTGDLADSTVSERCPEWSESIGVGSEDFLCDLQANLGIDGRHRSIETQSDEAYVLREQSPAYNCNNTGEIGTLSADNTIPWRLIH